METIADFFNNVLMPTAFALGVIVLPVALTIFIAVWITRKGKPGKLWMIILVPVLVYVVLAVLWVLLNLFAGYAESHTENDPVPSVPESSQPESLY